MNHKNGNADGESSASVRIYLLGGFEVRAGETALIGAHWPHRKAKAILKLLALQPSRSLHREQLLDRLWPTLGPEAAANNLRQNLHHLRRALAPAGVGAPVLLNELVSLAPGAWIDIEAFRSQARAAQASNDPKQYEEALALYRGDLLPEDLYKEWTEPAREELRNLRLQLFLQLSHLYERRRRVDDALQAAERAWEVDPLAEEPHYRLMQIYAATGRRDRAVRQFQRFRQSLDRSLGLEPSEQMEALYQKLLAGREETAVPGVETPNNLPARVTSFIGRERETAEIARMLGSRRLLTLAGAPGCGKTRLALEAAAEQLPSFPDGVWWVDLAPIADPALVPRAVTQVLGLAEAPNQDAVDALMIFSRARRLLIILDNCEHLVAACADLAGKLLHTCPTITILATSREPLNTAGESILVVSPLPAPEAESRMPPAALLRFDAMRLLVDRVSAVITGFSLTPGNSEAAARLCARLEGIPLAIELIAARARAFSLDEIAERLDQSFSLSTRAEQAALPRHETLSAALDWSYELLGNEEQALFRRLAVFAGSFDLPMAEEVCSVEPVQKPQVMELILRLVDRSMLTTVRSADSGVRYRLLEPLRQYAAKRLSESGEEHETRERHGAGFLARILDFENAMVVSPSGSRDYWVWILQEHHNLRAALRWALDTGEREKVLRLASCLTTYWAHAHPNEGLRWVEEAMSSAAGEASCAVEGWALHQQAWLNAHARGDFQGAGRLLEQSIALLRQTDEEWKRAYACGSLGSILMMAGDLERAHTLALEAYARFSELDNEFGLANSLALLWLIAQARGQRWLAGVFQAAAFSLLRQINEPFHMRLWFTRGAHLHMRQADYRRAGSLAAVSLPLSPAQSDMQHSTLSLDIIAAAAAARGDAQRASRLFGATRAILESMGLSKSTLDPSIYENHIGAVRHALGDDAFRKEWAAGQSMSLEQAIEYALSGTPALGATAHLIGPGG